MSNNDKPSSITLVEIAERFSKVTACIAIILLVMSVFYDYNFLIALGLSFNEIPSSTTEHVRSALLWIPYGASLLVFLGFEEARSRIEAANIVSTPIELSDSSVFQIIFSERRDKFIFIGMVIFILVYLFAGTDASWVYYLFFLAWIFLAASVLINKHLRPLFNRTSAKVFFLFPLAMGFVGLVGYNSGTKLLSGGPRWELTTRIGTITTTKKLIGIRRFSSFAITVDETRAVAIIPNDAILSAQLLQKSPPIAPNACRFLNIGCNLFS